MYNVSLSSCLFFFCCYNFYYYFLLSNWLLSHYVTDDIHNQDQTIKRSHNFKLHSFIRYFTKWVKEKKHHLPLSKKHMTSKIDIS